MQYDTIQRGYYTVARRYEFYVRASETISFWLRDHKIDIFGPRCNVLFILWRPDVADIADFYFIVFHKSSKFYISPFVFIENSKHPTVLDLASSEIQGQLVEAKRSTPGRNRSGESFL